MHMFSLRSLLDTKGDRLNRQSDIKTKSSGNEPGWRFIYESDYHINQVTRLHRIITRVNIDRK